MELEACRQEIDGIDQEITGLLERRMHVVAAVAAYKESHNMPVYDYRRELLVLDRIASRMENKELVPYIQHIYKSIMNESKAYERAHMAR